MFSVKQNYNQIKHGLLLPTHSLISSQQHMRWSSRSSILI